MKFTPLRIAVAVAIALVVAVLLAVAIGPGTAGWHDYSIARQRPPRNSP